MSTDFTEKDWQDHGGTPLSAAALEDLERRISEHAERLGSIWHPEDHGFVAWNFDIYQAASTASPSAGRLHLVRVPVRRTITFTRILCHVPNAGATMANTYLAAYSKAGALLGATADLGAAFTTTGLKNEPMSGGAVTVQRSEEWFRLGVLIGSAGTMPTLAAMALALSTQANANQAPADYRTSTAAPSGLTAPPASITPSSQSSFGSRAIWMAAL